MATPSNAAKALSVLTFTAGIGTNELAVQLYNALEAAPDDAALRDTMDAYSAVRWDGVDSLSTLDWWSEINTLAKNFDQLTKEMAAP